MRRITLFLAAILALCLLCGCTADDTPKTTETAAAAVETAPAETATEPSIDTLPIAPDRHEREEAYMAAFQTQRLSFGSVSLHMESRIYEEELLRSCAEIVRDDLTAAKRAAGEKPGDVTIYIVEKTTEGCPMTAGAELFCTVDDVQSGDYRPGLFGTAYGLPTQWQREGLTEFVFGEANDAELKGYYSVYNRWNSALAAFCSALHLSPVLSDEKTVRAARNTARSLTAFLLETKDFSAFRAATDTTAVLPQWADALGLSVDSAALWLWKNAELAELRIRYEKNYVCVVQVKNFSFYLTDDCFLMDYDGHCSDALYYWLSIYFSGMDMVMDQLRAEAPAAAEIAERKLAEPIRFYFINGETTSSYSNPYRNEIYLTRYDVGWHETLHVLLTEPTGSAEFGWINEGLAEHFSYRAATEYASVSYISDGFDAYLEFFAEVSGREANADDLVFHNSVRNIYEALRDPEITEGDDQEAYYRAYGISSLLLDGVIERSQVRIMYDGSVASKRGQKCGMKQTDGNALSYPEAEILTEYLMETYGADAVIDAYLNAVPLDKAFGISYSELYKAAKAYYAERYGALLATED